MMNTGDEMSKKGEKSYFSNLLHNLSDSCTKNISHCQTKHHLPPKIGGKNTKCSFSRQEIETFHNVGSKIICLKVISYVTVESVSIKSGFFAPDKDI